MLLSLYSHTAAVKRLYLKKKKGFNALLKSHKNTCMSHLKVTLRSEYIFECQICRYFVSQANYVQTSFKEIRKLSTLAVLC